MRIKDISGGNQRTQDFLDEEGIPLCQRIQGLQCFCMDGLSCIEDSMKHRVYMVAGEGRQREFGSQALPIKFCQPLPEEWANFFAPVGQEDKQWVASTAPCQVVEIFQAGVIAPVHVLYNEQDWLCERLTCEELCQCFEETTFFLFGIERCELEQRRWIREQKHQVRE